MRLIATDIIAQYRPNPCDLRVWLRHQGEPQRDPTEFEEVLYRLGDRHDQYEGNYPLPERHNS
jgi:hypothetical protein